MDARRSALLVDDDGQVLAVAQRMLAEAGYEVVAITDFARAKSRLRTETFDLLVADVRLGEFNGLQLALEARLRNPETVIVTMTGFDDTALRDEVAGYRGAFLRKPFTQAAMRDAIEAAAAALRQ